jgi:hypothetical protein
MHETGLVMPTTFDRVALKSFTYVLFKRSLYLDWWTKLIEATAQVKARVLSVNLFAVCLIVIAA